MCLHDVRVDKAALFCLMIVSFIFMYHKGQHALLYVKKYPEMLRDSRYFFIVNTYENAQVFKLCTSANAVAFT